VQRCLAVELVAASTCSALTRPASPVDLSRFAGEAIWPLRGP
jgi:hypothetical protein